MKVGVNTLTLLFAKIDHRNLCCSIFIMIVDTWIKIMQIQDTNIVRTENNQLDICIDKIFVKLREASKRAVNCLTY
jgi:hypothetical protein